MTEVTPSLENSRYQALFKITVLRSPAESSRAFAKKERKKKEDTATCAVFVDYIIECDYDREMTRIRTFLEQKERIQLFVANPVGGMVY